MRIAEKVALSPSPCLRRVKSLEENGFINKQVALLDQENLKLTDIEKPSSIHRTIKQFFYVKLILIGVASVIFVGLLTNVFLS